MGSPSMIGPQSKSIRSLSRSATAVLVATLITGTMGFPVGVPRPVENNTTFTPAATSPVTASTSLPGVQTRDSPESGMGSA